MMRSRISLGRRAMVGGGFDVGFMLIGGCWEGL